MLHVKVVNCQDGNCATSPVTYDCLLVRCYAPKKEINHFLMLEPRIIKLFQISYSSVSMELNISSNWRMIY